MSNINAESVKTKLQSLLTASNAKTGKSDANLTDAVNTLLEGYGQGGGGGSTGGECPINIVDELPAEGVEGAYYAVKGLHDVVMVAQGVANSMVDGGEAVNGIVATSETLSLIEPQFGMFCYVTDIQELYMYYGSWRALSEFFGGQCLGEITNISEADTSTDGYYAVIGIVDLYKCIGGQFKKLFLKGDLKYTSNGDGTCYVSGIGDYHDADIVIPSVAPNGDRVTSIGYDAFNGCISIKSITIPDSVTDISSGAFSDCTGLTSVTIPDSVTSISDFAFKGCRSLTSVTIPDGATINGMGVFQNCSGLTSITIPDSAKHLNSSAFSGCRSLTSITFDGVTKIGQSAFSGCSGLTSITIPDGVTNISGYAFSGCSSLTSITFEGTVAQWNAITKSTGWNSNIPVTSVTCSDGNVTL